MKIKKRAGWYRNIPPSRGIAPRKPDKYTTFTTAERIALVDDCCSLDGLDICHYNYSEVHVRNWGYQIEFYVEKNVKKPNPRYASEYKRWKEAHAKWQAGKAAFKQELKDWEAWRLQEDAKDAKEQEAKNLAWARKILRESESTSPKKKK